MILNSPYISGSLTVTGNITAQGGINISGSIASASYAVSASEASKLQGLGSASFAPASTFNTVSQSYAASSASLSTRVTTNETNISTLTSASASFAVVSSSYAAASGSLSTRVTNVETTASVLTSASSSFATMSGSLSTRVTNLEATSSTVSQSFASTSGSISGRVTLIEGQYATTGSNNFTGPQFVNQASNAISFTSTASLYTDGGLRVSKDSFVSGTAYFNNITVYGTSSIEYITSSQVNIGSNVITVNTDTPAIRFGGISVFDSGSTQLTGSLFWDSEKNHWIYSNPSGSVYNSAMLMNGPRNTGSLGTEQGTTACYLMAGQGGDHITSSQIYTDSNATCFYGTSYISASGDACFAGTVCAPSFVGGTMSGTTIFGSTIACSPIGCFATSCATSFIGGTMSGTTIYGSTAVCSPVGKFTTCIDAGSGIFSSCVKSTRYLITPSGVSSVYNFVDSDQLFAGSYNLQAGGGSSGYGGSLVMFGHSHATKPGYVVAGISAGSGGKFTVNNAGNGGGTELFTVDVNGVATFSSTITGTTIYGSTAVCSPVGKFTTCLDLGGVLTGTSATFSMPSGNGALTIANSCLSGKNWTLLPNTNGAESDLLLYYAGASAGTRLTIASTGASTFACTIQANGGNITSFSSVGAATFGNGINIHTQPGTYTTGHGGILQFQNEDVITGGIRAIRDGGSWGGALLFYTHNTSAGNTFDTTFVERMRITSDGNVLIGTGTTPEGPLDVYKSNSAGLGGHILLRNNGAAVGNETAVLFVDGGVGSTRAAISSTTEGAPYFGDLKFKTGASAYASLNTRMTITGAGITCFSNTVCAPTFRGGSFNGTNYTTISSQGTISASSTATILTLSSSAVGVYIVQGNFGGQGNAAYGSTLIVVANLGDFRIVTNGSGSNSCLTLSGANVQIQNVLGVSLDAYASAILIGN